jgi:iron complex outermembrane receptor protein
MAGGSFAGLSNRNEVIMKKKVTIAMLLVLALAGYTLAQQAKGQEKRTYAQKLVDNLFEKRQDLVSLGIHVTPPGGSDNVIIASNVKSKLGKKSSEPDMLVMTSGNPLVQQKPDNVYDIVLPLQQRSGKTIGIVGMNLRCKAGESEASALLRARSIVAGLNKQIPSEAKLFQEVQ